MKAQRSILAGRGCVGLVVDWVRTDLHHLLLLNLVSHTTHLGVGMDAHL